MKSNMNPWWWIPTLYFAEGLPYFIVNNISVIMFNNMGMPKGEMALYTSMLYLPWVIKPLWSPFVDIIKTKRWWISAMQIIMSAAFALLAFSLPHPSAEVIAEGTISVSLFKLTLVLFWITAFASATHDIAAELGACKGERKVVGFALETDNEFEHAEDKLIRKNLDFIVLNSLRDQGAGLGVNTNKITILRPNGMRTAYELKSKTEVARDIVDELIAEFEV
jgi:hypothetical protein